MTIFAQGFDGDAVGGWEDEDLVGAEADLVDGVGVDEVEVVAGGEDRGDDLAGHEFLHGSGDGDVGWGEAGPGVVGGEEDGDLVGGLALAEEPADALDVAGDVGHDGMPGVVVVEDGGGVEAPAGFGDGGLSVRDGPGGVGPAVEDELVFSHDEVDVGFGLHVEWRGAEDGGVEPGEGFAGGDVVVENVIGGGGPAECGKRSPLWTLAFGECDEVLAGEGNSWFSIGLRAKLRVMGDGPVIDLGQVIFVDQFGEGLAPIVPYLLGGGSSSGNDFGEMGEEIVAATLLKFGGEGGGPVGSVGFEGVGEDGVGWGGGEGFDEGFADFGEVGGDGVVGEGIEDVAFGSDGGAFDLLFGVAGDEEEGSAGGWDGGDGAASGWDGLGGGGVPLFGFAVDDGGGDEGFAFGERGGGDRGDVGGDGDFGGAEAAGGFGEGGVGAAVGPAAAEGDVDAEAELPAFGLGVVDGVEHGGGEEGEVLEIFGGIVEDLGVDEGEFGSADAVGFHLLELAEDLGFFHSGAEPPPTNHGTSVRGRILKVGLE